MEEVVLLDEVGRATGTTDKATVHHAETPLHLAFSCYLFNPRGELLLTRRAHDKTTWPGVWTNSCCGHPAPGEPLAEAVRRRLTTELGITATTVELVLPRFRYRAEMGNGIVENEMCPVFRAVADAHPEPEPDEVSEVAWVDWPEFTERVLRGDATVSPWCESQVRELVALGSEPTTWPLGRVDDLPPAARTTG
jgi:isopentenyl-diphosphate delta-isomerase